MPSTDCVLQKQREPILIREFGPVLLYLRLQDGYCLKFTDGAVEVLRAAMSGASRAEIASLLAHCYDLEVEQTTRDVDRILGLVGTHSTSNAIGAALGASAGPTGFAPALWDPPTDFSAPKLPARSSLQHWLLLVAATSRRQRAEEALRQWRAIPSRARDRTARRLLPLVLAKLSAQGADIAVAEGWPRMRHMWIDNELSLYRLRGLLQRFDEAGIRLALLKGVATVLLDYRDPALRPVADLDVLVPFADRCRAMELLREEGFAPIAPEWDERLAHCVHAKTFLGPDRLNIDLHWHALWNNCWEGADDQLWATARRYDLQGAPYFAPDPALRLLIVVVHGRHSQGVPAHGWIADAAMILTAHGETLDWDRLIEEARARRVTRPLREALAYLISAFGAPVPSGVLERLRRARIGALDNILFHMHQKPRPKPRGVLATDALFNLVSQCRTSTRGFPRREVYDLLGEQRIAPGSPGMPSLFVGLVRKGLRHGGRELYVRMKGLARERMR